ncbi:MAG TPA: hypothetical protein VM658_07785 [bacterium]|nr:hypothetical protein [bacterium]
MSKKIIIPMAVAIAAVLALACPLAAADGPNNLGPRVNSADSDFGPIVTADGNALYFTSDRDGGFGGQDIWLSRRVNGEWTQAVNLGDGINTKYSEGPDSFAVDERTMYFTRCDRLDQAGICDVFTASWDPAKKQWSNAARLGTEINSEYNDANASISFDGKTLYFVSDRPAPGKTERNWDIFVARKKGDKWQKARRLGPPVNTPLNEIHVVVQKDDKTLYFSSDGHGGQGGTDIFYSRIEDGKFSEPVNMGDSINTPDNDIYFTIPSSGDMAYLASNRPGGLGMEDIYSVPLDRIELMPSSKGLVLVRGMVADKSTCQKPAGADKIDVKTCKPLAATVRINQMGSMKPVLEKPTGATGAFQATLPLQKGYTITASADGFKPVSEELRVEEGKPYQVVEINLLLEPN